MRDAVRPVSPGASRTIVTHYASVVREKVKDPAPAYNLAAVYEHDKMHSRVQKLGFCLGASRLPQMRSHLHFDGLSPCRTLALPGPPFSVINPSLTRMFTSQSASTQKRAPCMSEPTRLRLHSHGKDLQGRHGTGRPGVVISCCPSTLECRGAVACSEVPAFRYESALGLAEQEMAERGTSVRCP
jgi:hypothetical protein